MTDGRDIARARFGDMPTFTSPQNGRDWYRDLEDDWYPGNSLPHGVRHLKYPMYYEPPVPRVSSGRWAPVFKHKGWKYIHEGTMWAATYLAHEGNRVTGWLRDRTIELAGDLVTRTDKKLEDLEGRVQTAVAAVPGLVLADERLTKAWDDIAANKKAISELQADVLALKEQVGQLRARL